MSIENIGETPPPKKPGAVRTFLTADRAPMWFTVAALLAGAGGTYFIAPQVNARFEAQKIKTDFVIRNYNDLRTKFEDFQGLYTTAVQKQLGGESVQADFMRLQEMVARISAQNMALMPMFVSEGGPRAVAQVHGALNGLLQVILTHAGQDLSSPQATQSYDTKVREAQAKLVAPLLELYVRIAEVGNLNPTEKDAELQGD
jgi:hypothetical protein